MWSTATVIFFFCAQSLTQLSNQVSYFGTKWLHSRMLNPDFLPPPPPAVQEASSGDPTPSATAATPLVFMKSRRLSVCVWRWGFSSSSIGTPDRNETRASSDVCPSAIPRVTLRRGSTSCRWYDRAVLPLTAFRAARSPASLPLHPDLESHGHEASARV